MTNDRYLRGVLTVIAAALVYLCVVLTPFPTASAQSGQVVGAPRPGESTGPGEMVIVGWRVPESATIPVHITHGDVRIINDALRVTGQLQTDTTLVGWEDNATEKTRGQFRPFGTGTAAGRALPVEVRQQKP
jgi:hypothetical protein